MEDVAESFSQVRQYMQGAGEDLQGVTQNAIAFCVTFGVTSEEAFNLLAQVVTQLGSIQGKFDETKNSMEQINQVKYNTPMEAMEGLGRQIETIVLLPISQELMPSLNDASSELAKLLQAQI